MAIEWAIHHGTRAELRLDGASLDIEIDKPGDWHVRARTRAGAFADAYLLISAPLKATTLDEAKAEALRLVRERLHAASTAVELAILALQPCGETKVLADREVTCVLSRGHDGPHDDGIGWDETKGAKSDG